MEKYLVDAAPLRQSRPADYSCDAATGDGDDDDDVGGRGTPALHVHDLASLRSSGTSASLTDVKPLRGINSDGMQTYASPLVFSGVRVDNDGHKP